MPARKKDLSQEIYIKTMRARVLETKAATEYPDKRVELLAEVDQLRAEAAELRKEAAKEKRAVTKQLKDAALEYAVAREQFLKLHLGFNAHDPGINLYDGNRAGAGQGSRSACRGARCWPPTYASTPGTAARRSAGSCSAS